MIPLLFKLSQKAICDTISSFVYMHAQVSLFKIAELVVWSVWMGCFIYWTSGLNWIDLDWTRVDWTRSWTGLEWNGLDWSDIFWCQLVHNQLWPAPRHSCLVIKSHVIFNICVLRTLIWDKELECKEMEDAISQCE